MGSEFPPENTDENNERSSDSERGPTRRGWDGPSADITALINAQTRQADADRNERRRTDHGRSCREWATIVLLFFAFAATVVQAIIFHGQLDEMRKVYGPVKDSADAAKKAADVAETQPKIA